ncbi:MBL fold metallo-hydrolase [Methanococcus aeolicus]|uniref:MBL fold metallo-hydrolase n=1 Tax=Methanococcus aeolicus TaxID=42879 RepID=UPI0021C905C3|nr:MBL fold metallo-hydrolase [Methanococcus aeolicus]UXM84713.1 MBL fold metallo-hydrolase [Methanococcus aeolicus]
MHAEIIFLGAGGGRWATITQNRGTGGFRIHTEKTNLHIDPGPGALVRMADLKLIPYYTNAIFISHDHPDHYTDAEVMIEAMTYGMTKNIGYIISNISVLNGYEKYENAISKYHQSKSEIHILNPKESANIHDIELIATPTKHGDPKGIGCRVKTNKGDIGYTSDTELIEPLKDCFDGVKVLVANVVRKKNNKLKGHLCSNDLIDLLNSMKNKPELVVINHIGIKMSNPIKECEYIKDNTSVKIIPAKIGLKIELYDKRINISYLGKKTEE